MQHPDEGMIHSWLDGALSPEEAAQVESHVSECASCAAAVADARGFIAASSRILTALDDVPRGVLPAVPAKKRDFRIVWRAAAAMLVVAGGSLVVMREGGPDARVAATPDETASATISAPATAADPTPSSATDGTGSASEARPLAGTGTATIRSAPAVPPAAAERRADSRRERDLSAMSDIQRSAEPGREMGQATGRGAIASPPRAPMQANRAIPESDAAPLKVVRVEAMPGGRRTIYEIAPSQTVTLTEAESMLPSAIVVTGAAAGVAAGAPRPAAERRTTQAAPMSAEAAKSAAPPPPPVMDSRTGVDSVARNETAAARTSSILQAQESARFAVRPNTISWTEARTGKTLTLSGNVSVETLQGIRRRIEKARASSAKQIP